MNCFDITGICLAQFLPFLLRNAPVTSGFYNFVSGNNINFEGLPTGIGKLYNLVSCQL